jgi:DNA polymerase-1
VTTCWDVAAVERLIVGGWRTDPARVWAQLHGLATDAIPTVDPVDLFTPTESEAELDEPVRPDGHLRPQWLASGWTWTPARLGRWAELALEAASLQLGALAALVDRPMAVTTARSESAAEVLCAELSVEGLPMDRATAEQIIAGFIGARPRSDVEIVRAREHRDADVLRHSPVGKVDLRNPSQVKSLLRSIGVEVPDTRAWRLEALQDQHPLVTALLAWRRAERVATTFGYDWLDEHLGADGRLRGTWSGSDGAAGRMTATAGLHNMPAHMRAAVIAEPGHVFVRADLGQIEPRVLAAVSRDAALARAAAQDDMYAPVASQLGVDRATAKIAVLGAMYGQTTGHGAQALRRLEASYPVAMAYLTAADLAGQAGNDLRTYGGRLVRMGSTDTSALSDRDARSRSAARGRFGRNALVQGAAAEFFKLWAVIVRSRATPFGARIVLCLHDELLVHAPVEHGRAVAGLLEDCLAEAAHRWAGARSVDVRFVADIAVIERWSDAKP